MVCRGMERDRLAWHRKWEAIPTASATRFRAVQVFKQEFAYRTTRHRYCCGTKLRMKAGATWVSWRVKTLNWQLCVTSLPSPPTLPTSPSTPQHLPTSPNKCCARTHTHFFVRKGLELYLPGYCFHTQSSQPDSKDSRAPDRQAYVFSPSVTSNIPGTGRVTCQDFSESMGMAWMAVEELEMT